MACSPDFIGQIVGNALNGNGERVLKFIRLREKMGHDSRARPYGMSGRRVLLELWPYGSDPVRELYNAMMQCHTSHDKRVVEGNLTRVAMIVRREGYFCFAHVLEFLVESNWLVHDALVSDGWAWPKLFECNHTLRRARNMRTMFSRHRQEGRSRLTTAMRTFSRHYHEEQHDTPHIQALSKLRASTLAKGRLTSE